MSKNPLITVVTVVLNAKEHIEQTIQSVINQTYSNIEYIIVDGGSTDGTLDIINKYKDKIAVIISEPDKGIFDAMNKGIDIATGEWINFMNAGDYFYTPDVLEKIFKDKLIEEDFIYGGHAINYYFGEHILTKEIPVTNKAFWRKMPCHQSSFVKTKHLKSNKFNIDDPLERMGGDYAKLLDFYYKKKLAFRKENMTIAFFRSGGFSPGTISENPSIDVIKHRYKVWLITSRYVNDYCMHLRFFYTLTRMFLFMIILKLIPDKLRCKVFDMVH